MSTTDHRNRKSNGHICFAGDFEFYKQADEHGELQIIRAKRGNAFDLEGHRHGRWECSAAFLAARDFETVTGLQPEPEPEPEPEPAVPTGRAAHDADPPGTLPTGWIEAVESNCQPGETAADIVAAQLNVDGVEIDGGAVWDGAHQQWLSPQQIDELVAGIG